MPARLSSDQKRKLEQVCGAPTNWSDSGRWQGAGDGPNCFRDERSSATLTLVVNFPSDDSALRWNSLLEKQIRYSSYALSIALSPVLLYRKKQTVALLGLIFSNAGTIVMGESVAAIEYPRVARGSKYRLSASYDYRWSPHPWNRKSLNVAVSERVIHS